MLWRRAGVLTSHPRPYATLAKILQPSVPTSKMSTQQNSCAWQGLSEYLLMSESVVSQIHHKYIPLKCAHWGEIVAAASSTPSPKHTCRIAQKSKWQDRKFSLLFNPNFWYFNVTDFLSQMSASLLFFLSLSQQAYKYFQWNFTKWHVLLCKP